VRAALPVLAVVVCGVLCGARQAAGGQAGAAGTQGAFPASPQATQDEAAGEWSFSAAVYVYRVVDDSNYAQPTFTVDRDWLHLEGRYNYEDLETGSLWMGYNFGGGETLTWELTPMLGGVFGNTSAVAPGYKASLGWSKVEFSSEGEYVFDANDSSDNFLYNWSELSVAPVEWWRIGLVTQRTRVHASEREVERGLLVGFAYRELDSTLYVFNPDDSAPLVVVGVTLGF
jgi:hypothetical protein